MTATNMCSNFGGKWDRDWSGPGRTLRRQPMAFVMLYGQMSLLCNWKHPFVAERWRVTGEPTASVTWVNIRW